MIGGSSLKEEIKCDICGKTDFKSKAGLAGHKKIAHGADKRKTVPDEIGRRLRRIELALNRIVGSRVAKDMAKISMDKELSAEETNSLLEKDNYAIVTKCVELFFSDSDYKKTLGEYFTKELEK